MAYNKAEFERIDKMPLGDLVQYMISHYEPYGHSDDKEAHMQSSEYYHAYERLNHIYEQIQTAWTLAR